MLLNVFFAAVILAVLQNVQAVINNKTFVLIIHSASGKVVASDGTLWDYDGGEEWKQWIAFTKGDPGNPPSYILKTGLSPRPASPPQCPNVSTLNGTKRKCLIFYTGYTKKLYPRIRTGLWKGSVVMGTKDLKCTASQVDKVPYHTDDESSELWQISKTNEPIPIYNKCSKNNQLIVKHDGKYNRIFTASPSSVKAGDKNAIFEVVPTNEYKGNTAKKQR